MLVLFVLLFAIYCWMMWLVNTDGTGRQHGFCIGIFSWPGAGVGYVGVGSYKNNLGERKMEYDFTDQYDIVSGRGGNIILIMHSYRTYHSRVLV